MDNDILKISINGNDTIYIREWINEDIEELPLIASNRKIWLNLRDSFPHPYTRIEAAKWVRLCKKQKVKTWCAIADGDKLIGSIGIFPNEDIFKHSSELGYWLAESYWGKGIMTAAILAFTRYVFLTFRKTIRIYAGVFDYNIASQKVLEKAGYQFEGRMRQHVTKAGKTCDELVYAKLRNE